MRLTCPRKSVLTEPFGRPVERDGYALAEALLTRGRLNTPTALFTGSKLLTLGALRYLLERGVRVPEEVALASFDALDWLPNQPDMLVAEQPAYALGAGTAGLLLARFEDPGRPTEHLVLPSAVKRVGRAAAVL